MFAGSEVSAIGHVAKVATGKFCLPSFLNLYARP